MCVFGVRLGLWTLGSYISSSFMHNVYAQSTAVNLKTTRGLFDTTRGQKGGCGKTLRCLLGDWANKSSSTYSMSIDYTVSACAGRIISLMRPIFGPFVSYPLCYPYRVVVLEAGIPLVALPRRACENSKTQSTQVLCVRAQSGTSSGQSFEPQVFFEHCNDAYEDRGNPCCR